MLKAVIFDMYETLITQYQSPVYFGAQIAADAGIEEERFQKLWRQTERDRTIGNMTLEEALQMILQKNRCDSEALRSAIVRKRVQAKEACFRHLHREILPLLCSLKERGLLLGVISNCYSEEVYAIRRSVLYPYFDTVCLSYEQGLRKPDAEIYRICMKNLGVQADECLYIGDGGCLELEAAKEVGMRAVQAVWYLPQSRARHSGRKADFQQIENPLAVLDVL